MKKCISDFVSSCYIKYFLISVARILLLSLALIALFWHWWHTSIGKMVLNNTLVLAIDIYL